MNISIKKVIIKEQYDLLETMMKELQASEQRMNNRSAAWEDIRENYMHYLISAQEENEGTCLLAKAEERPAGFLFGYLEEQDDSRIEIYKEKELYISDGFVYPMFRRMGIYQQLNDQMEHIYIAKGIRRITRFTMVTNDPMNGFLQKQGYQATRLLYEKWLDKEGRTIIPANLLSP